MTTEHKPDAAAPVMDRRRWKTAPQIVRAMRERLATPEQWISEHMAENAAGRMVDPIDRSAVRWSILGAWGAATHCTRVRDRDAADNALRIAMMKATGDPAISAFEFGPKSRHGELLSAIDAAIADLDAQEAPCNT